MLARYQLSPGVCLSVCHKSEFCQNGWACRANCTRELSLDAQCDKLAIVVGRTKLAVFSTVNVRSIDIVGQFLTLSV